MERKDLNRPGLGLPSERRTRETLPQIVTCGPYGETLINVPSGEFCSPGESVGKAAKKR